MNSSIDEIEGALIQGGGLTQGWRLLQICRTGKKQVNSRQVNFRIRFLYRKQSVLNGPLSRLLCNALIPPF